MPKKKLTLPKLKKKLDRIFSQYIRLRDADDNGYVTCITCGKTAHYKEMHAGHFRKRRHEATRWDKHNVHPQCVTCNTFNEGEQYLYSKYIANEYGEQMPDMLTMLSRDIVRFSRSDIEEKIKFYKGKLDEIY